MKTRDVIGALYLQSGRQLKMIYEM